MATPTSTPTPPTNAAAPAAPKAAGYDPVALAESLAAAAEKSAKLMGDFAAKQAETGKTIVNDELGIGKAFMEVAAKMLANPYRLAESQMNLWWDYMLSLNCSEPPARESCRSVPRRSAWSLKVCMTRPSSACSSVGSVVMGVIR